MSGTGWNEVLEEEGRHQASGVPTPAGRDLGCRRGEQWGETRKEGSSLSVTTGGLAHG